MKLLIAIKNQDNESKNILEMGCKIAAGFSADLTICFVGKKSKSIIEGEINLARLSMSEWNILHPGLEVLKWAFNILKEKGFTPDSKFDIKNFTEENGRIRSILPKTKNYQIKLVLREGELLSELKNEVKYGKFDIIINSSPKKERTTQKIVQFLDTSILFVKNYKPNINYKILLCVDDSRSTKKAIIFCTHISKQFNADITLITVSKTSFLGKGYRNAHDWADKYLKRSNLKFESKLLQGNPVDIFVKEANENHIIIMGKAKGNELIKFLLGSKPIHTAQKANCPVLIIN